MEEKLERAYFEFLNRRENMKTEQAVFDLFRKAFIMGYRAALEDTENPDAGSDDAQRSI